MSGLVQTIAPAAEPITLATAKLHMRITDTAQDAIIPGLIAAARFHAEMVTRRALVTQQWMLVLDSFPGYGIFAPAIWTPFGVGTGSGFADYHALTYSVVATKGNEVVLPLPHLQSVDSITYLDTNGVRQTLDPANYVVSAGTEPARIAPAYSKWWPPTRPQVEAVQITFTAGYSISITFDATANTLTLVGPAGATPNAGDVVRLSNQDGGLAAPLVVGLPYYVVNSSGREFQVSLTSGGAPIDLTTAGTGTHWLNPIPDGIIAWMLMRIATLYANREEVAILNRGKVELLPFVDYLLNPYRVLTF